MSTPCNLRKILILLNPEVNLNISFEESYIELSFQIILISKDYTFMITSTNNVKQIGDRKGKRGMNIKRQS